MRGVRCAVALRLGSRCAPFRAIAIASALLAVSGVRAPAQDASPPPLPPPPLLSPDPREGRAGDWSIFSPVSLRDNSAVLTASPTNWRDTQPFRFFVDQSVRYNDNVLLLPKSTLLPAGFSRGDWSSVTTLGASARANVSAQTFFVRGNLGLTRYAEDTSMNADSHLVEGGWDWVFTSRCSGRLLVASRKTEAPYEQLTSPVINNIQTTSFNETAKCQIADHVNVIADSGLSKTTNSLVSVQRNDNEQYFLRGGLEYEFALLNTLGVQATFRNTDFTNRSPSLTPGLATELDQRSYEVFYRRLLSPKLEFDGTVGVTETTTHSPVSSSSFSLVTYSVKLKWQATPKTAFIASTSLKVGPPQNIVADYERIYEHALAALYLYSPRLSFSGSVGFSDQQNPTASGVNQSAVLAEQHVTFATLRAIYHISPFMNATADYRYTRRKDETTGLQASSNLFMLGLIYQR